MHYTIDIIFNTATLVKRARKSEKTKMEQVGKQGMYQQVGKCKTTFAMIKYM